ncbi:unnamed protein product [Oikopleura dioica]|uniref:Protein CNPPD1 n=1 Tax=Oikopleura dioica TaxID=34765 RepID=E4YZ18_OIKDI|nr:unnamed protein product [Oikopleura dioica]
MSAQDLRMSFLNSPDWEDRLRRTFLYPGTQSLDDVMPLDISEFCVEHFRELAPKNAGKLGPRIATRLMRNTALCPSAIVAALIYLQRLKAHNPEYLKKVESSELFIVSMMVSSKYLFDDGTDDECYNDEWASCLGMESKDLNKMELAFLTAIDWSCHIRNEDFMETLSKLEIQLAMQTMQKGVFTYNTAVNLRLMLSYWQFFKDLSKFYFVSALTLLSLASSMNLVGFQLSEINHSSGQNALHVNLTDIRSGRVPENGEELQTDDDLECSNPADINNHRTSSKDVNVERKQTYQIIKTKVKNQKGDENCYTNAYNDLAMCIKPLVLL